MIKKPSGEKRKYSHEFVIDVLRDYKNHRFPTKEVFLKHHKLSPLTLTRWAEKAGIKRYYGKDYDWEFIKDKLKEKNE